MKYWSRNPFGMDYGINKRRCEDVIWEAHDDKLLPVTVIRPTFVCGPKDPTIRDFFWIERILDGKPLLVPGSGEFKYQVIYVEDLARIFVDILNTESTIGKAYNAAADEIIILNKYLLKLAELLNTEVELVHIDQEKFDALSFSYSRYGDVFPFNTRRDAVFDISKIKNAIKFKSTPYDEWMTKTVDWYRKSNKKSSIGYDKRNEELKQINLLKNL